MMTTKHNFSQIIALVGILLSGCSTNIQTESPSQFSQESGSPRSNSTTQIVTENSDAAADCDHLSNAADSKPSTEFDSKESTDNALSASKTAAPRVSVLENTYDFGHLNPGTHEAHAFFVKNIGDAPLEMEFGDASCQCAVLRVPTKSILPGESGEILVEWKTKGTNKRFSERASIHTNDPTQPTIDFRIEGFIRTHLGADPPVLSLPTATPGVAESVSTYITSQVWESFEITDVTSSLQGFDWKIDVAPQKALDRLKSKSGFDFTVTIPDNLKRGPFSHWVRVKIDPLNGEEPHEYEIPIEGKVTRPVSVYGPNIDNNGKVTFGVVKSDKGAHQRYVVKVRDKMPELKIKRVITTPEFVEATLTSGENEGSRKGLYYLDIQIPQNSKTCQHIVNNGDLRIEFEHPRIESLDLTLEFAVVNSRRL